MGHPEVSSVCSAKAESEVTLSRSILVRRILYVYSVRVFQGRRFAAVKDAVILGLSRILAWLAHGEWIVTPGLHDNPPALQVVAVRKYPSRTQTFWGHIPEEWKGKTRWNHVKLIETEFTPPYPQMPKRSCVMNCRPLCGKNLTRIHTTCWLHCRIRRAYYGKLPKLAELRAVWSIGWAIPPAMNSIHKPAREVLFKRIALIMEAAGS